VELNEYNVHIDPSASTRFAHHLEFLARVSENAAFRLYDDYDEALGFLENNPESCPLYYLQIPIDEELRYKLFGERYRIVFEIIANDVYVYDIQDCRQNTDKNLV